MSLCVVYIVTSEAGNNIGERLRQEILQKCEYLPITVKCIRFHRDNDFKAGNIGLNSIETILESRLSLAKQAGSSLGEIYWLFLFTPDVKSTCKAQYASTTLLANLSYIYAYWRKRTISAPRFFFFYPNLPDKCSYSPGKDALKKISQQIIGYDCSFGGAESLNVSFDKAVRDFVEEIYADWYNMLQKEAERFRQPEDIEKYNNPDAKKEAERFRQPEDIEKYNNPDAKNDEISMLWSYYYASSDPYEKKLLLDTIKHRLNCLTIVNSPTSIF